MALIITPEKMQKLQELNDSMPDNAVQAASADDSKLRYTITPEKLQRLSEMNQKAELDEKNQGEDRLFNTLKNPLQSALSEQAPSVDYVNDARDLAQGAVQGVVNIGDLINKGETYGVNKLFGTNFKAPDVSDVAAPIGSGNQGMQANLARGIGGYILPGATVTKLAKPVSLLGRMIAQGSAGAINGAANAPEGQKGYSALIDGLMGALVPGGLKQGEAARPSRFLRGAYTDDELRNNLAATKGTTTGLGDVIGNKGLKSTLETILPSLPFTGATNTMRGTVNDLQAKAQSIFQKLLPNGAPEDSGSAIQYALRQSKKDIMDEKKSKESALNSAADEAGLKVGRDNQIEYATNKLSEIKEDPELMSYVPKSVIKDLENHASGKFGEQTLKAADISGGNTALGSKASSFYNSGDGHSGKIYQDLIEAKKADVDKALDTTENEKIKSLRDDYRAFYADEYVPFTDEDVKKFTDYGEGDTDTLVNKFIQTSRASDRPKLLSKLMQKLEPNHKNLVTHAYYSPAIDRKTGNVDLNLLRSLHQKLGDKQKDVLFNNPEDKDSMDNLIHAMNLNPEPLKALANFSTGARNSQWAPYVLAGSMASKGYQTHGLLGALGGAIAGVAAPAVVGKGITKALTSEKIRNSLVTQMLNKNPRIYTPNKIAATNAVAQGILNALNGKSQ